MFLLVIECDLPYYLLYTSLLLLQSLLVDFTENQPHVNALNEIGYRISLDRHNSGHLATLNDWWNKLYTRLSEKYRHLQGVLLQQQSFAQKCKSWMRFLAETEQNLAVDIAGSYDELLEQQKVYEVSGQLERACH